MTDWLKPATDGIAGALGTSPLGAGMAIGGAIMGAIGMRKRRKAERKRKRRERAHALKTQEALISSVSDIREEYRERAGFGRKAFDQSLQAGMLDYQSARGDIASQIGATGFAYSGGGQRASSMLDRSFAMRNQERKLGYEQEVFGLERQLEGELRGVQMGLLDLEATAASRGYRLQSKGQSGPRVDTRADLGGI